MKAQQPIKVLGFDSWTKGAHHFDRLIPALQARNMSLKLVHLGTWGNDPRKSLVERVGQLDVADIASYPSYSLRRMLEIERPDVVVLLSTTTFAHRALVRHCRAMGIPTLNLYHGMSTTWFDPAVGGGFEPNALGHLRIVTSKLYKTLRFTLPCYAGALLRTRAGSADWKRFFSDLTNLAVGKQPIEAAEDARTTRCAVYTASEVDHATVTFRFPADEIAIVGNPDLARFGLATEHLGSRLRHGALPTGAVMYIDTALQPNGLVYPNLAAFVDHLKLTARSLAACGLRLKLKLHPANDIESIRRLLAPDGVELATNENFVDQLLKCDAAIVETTTLAMIPALMGMPMFFANYGALQRLQFGSALTSYPRGRFLTDVREFSTLLQEVQRDREVAGRSERWIAESSGPLPAERMPDRVAALLEELARPYSHAGAR